MPNAKNRTTRGKIFCFGIFSSHLFTHKVSTLTRFQSIGWLEAVVRLPDHYGAGFVQFRILHGSTSIPSYFQCARPMLSALEIRKYFSFGSGSHCISGILCVVDPFRRLNLKLSELLIAIAVN